MNRQKMASKRFILGPAVAGSGGIGTLMTPTMRENH